MMVAETKPTPKPATKRPATIRPRPVEAVCKMTPMMKIAHPTMTVVRRPIQSARSPARTAPKKVPADRIDVIKDLSEAGRTKAASSAFEALGPGIGLPV